MGLPRAFVRLDPPLLCFNSATATFINAFAAVVIASLGHAFAVSVVRFGLLRVSLSGGHILVPSASGAVGDQIRIRILTTDVSLAREPPGRSSILNVLPAQIVSDPVCSVGQG